MQEKGCPWWQQYGNFFWPARATPISLTTLSPDSTNASRGSSDTTILPPHPPSLPRYLSTNTMVIDCVGKVHRLAQSQAVDIPCNGSDAQTPLKRAVPAFSLHVHFLYS